MVFFVEKNQTAKKSKIWQFLNSFHVRLITSNAVPYAFVNLVLCVARWGQNIVGVCFIWTSVGSWGKMLERVAHTKRHRCAIKRAESQFCWTIHRQQVDCQIAILRWFFIRLNQLNNSIHGNVKILYNLSETSSRLNVKHSYGSIPLKMEEYLRFWH